MRHWLKLAVPLAGNELDDLGHHPLQRARRLVQVFEELLLRTTTMAECPRSAFLLVQQTQ